MDGLAISPFIASLPKVELHVHIEGTLLPSLRWSLAQKNNIALPYPTYEALLASYAGLAAYEAARPWAAAAVEGGGGLFHAVGLASNAYERPPLLFEEGFRRARADGLRVTMHCDFGQKDTHAHVSEAIFDVCGGRGAERIDHGLDAADDERLMAGLVERDIGLTLCPHAYHRRTATEVLFPKIRKLVDGGVKVCINSDDPVYMHDVWVDGNMQKVYTYCGMSKAQMVQLARNGVDLAWASAEIKQELYKELDAVNIDD
ncbi:hypothetical protein VdG1_04339 [Verticillium dahliae VDG1]|nr:hypothetical protein VdG1_04339 [Verticillium dahliae VDG1]